MQEFPGHEKGVETDTECHAGDLGSDSISDTDIRTITEKSEEPEQEAFDAVEFIETPNIASLRHESINDWRGQDDKETEKQYMRGT